MDIFAARQALRSKTIYELPLRVTFYARVSTEKDEQLNSLENQVTYYEDLIRKNPAWIYVTGYVDEGLSGISTKKREHFNRMVEDGKSGAFDLIITKEITRFARNTLDSIRYTRDLLSSGVAVFFQNDNINTLDEDSELRLTIMSGIAQDELRKLSSRVRFGHQQAIKSSVVLGNSRIFGYRKDHKRLVIDEKEAPMVRELFELYATDQYSMKQIEGIFWQKGYRNLHGRPIAHGTMSNMIANPKYKGYYVGNKVKVVDMFTKKQKFLPPEEWVMFRDETGEIVPAIVPEDLWNRANEILRRRSEDVKNRRGVCNHPNLLTGKLFCACCGEPYYRRESKKVYGPNNSKWVCSGKIKRGAASCPSFPIYESEIKPLLLSVFRDCLPDPDALVEEYLRMYRELKSQSRLSSPVPALEKIIENAEKKKSKLLQLSADGMITDRDFKQMTDGCNDEILRAQREIDALKEQTALDEARENSLIRIRKALAKGKEDAAKGVITKEFVDRYIDRILAEPQKDGSLLLDVHLFTGERSQKALFPLPRRTGHTFKRMIEQQERQMSGK